MARLQTQLTNKKIDKYMKRLPSWKLDKSYKKITNIYTFENHVDALVFVARVTVHAEVLQHRPDILYTDKKVKIILTTHRLKAITKVDFLLAERIEHLHNGG